MFYKYSLDDEMDLRFEIAKAKYLVHFREFFPERLFISRVLDDNVVIKIEKTIDDCIANNKPYPKPDGYDERLY